LTVYVVGSVNGDVTLPVEQLPAPGATVLSADPVRATGGKGANVAVATARDGGQVRLVAAVGDDDAGTQSLANLAREDVDTGGVAVVGQRPTGLAMICVDAAGENHIVVAPGANSALTSELVVAGLRDLGPRDVCVVSFEIPEEAVVTAARVAGERHGTLIVNPSPVRPLARELLDATPVMVANAGEVRQLTEEGDPSRGARALQTLGCTTVVVTLGADGARVRSAGSDADIAVYPARVTDTTGAGDTFTGVFATALARGSDAVEAADRAAVAAALSTQRVGAQSAMPATTEIDQAVQTRQGVRPPEDR
jgi:ribokinase